MQKSKRSILLTNWNFYLEDSRLQATFYDFFADFISKKRKKRRLSSEYVDAVCVVGNVFGDDGSHFHKRIVRTAPVVYIKKIRGKKLVKETGIGMQGVNIAKHVYYVSTRDGSKYYLRLRDILPEAIYRVNYINSGR